MRFPTIAFVAVLRSVVSFAQTSDLSDPRLQANATIVQHNLGSTPIPQMLKQVRAQASAKGIPWQGLHLVSTGHEGASTDMPLTTALLQVYQKQTCQADAIVIGHATASASHLSAYGTEIYSDYIFAIDTLLKDNTAAPIHARPDIVVTRLGGSLTLANGLVTSDVEMFPRLQPGITYLQFLKYIPQSTAYRPIDGWSTWRTDYGNLTMARQKYSTISLPGFTLAGIGPTVASWLGSCR